MKLLSPFTAGIKIRTIMIMMKFNTITSVLGVAPLNMPAKRAAKMSMYTIANDAIITIYEKILSQIELRFNVEYLRIV